mmetsp:Transcript_1711/g.5457  ORF Transcript_1711/g.5457 Transcript_1711/m.5457 type:complete len:417 (-) Transcript_1711:4521-5771(-)
MRAELVGGGGGTPRRLVRGRVVKVYLMSHSRRPAPGSHCRGTFRFMLSVEALYSQHRFCVCRLNVLLLTLLGLIPCCECFLVIGQPKCASSSLLNTLGHISGLKAVQKINKTGVREDRQKCPPSKARVDDSIAFQYISCIEGLDGALSTIDSVQNLKDCYSSLPHSDMLGIVDRHVLHKQINDHTVIHKNHYPPTAENVNSITSIRGFPVVLLTCDPSQSAVAYLHHRNLDGGTRNSTEFSPSNVFEFHHRLKWLSHWHNGWVSAHKRFPANLLLVTKSDFTSNPSQVISTIFNAWELKETPQSTNVTSTQIVSRRYNVDSKYCPADRSRVWLQQFMAPQTRIVNPSATIRFTISSAACRAIHVLSVSILPVLLLPLVRKYWYYRADRWTIDREQLVALDGVSLFGVRATESTVDN